MMLDQRTVLAVLKAAAEPTRLRLLMLLRAGELNVKDLTRILGQSQPRISRHLKLMAEALREYPLINASLIGEEICIWKNVNIAVAVAIGDDLVTPVIKSVERKSIQQISQELGKLVAKARENRLSVEDISGSTISITNIGALGANPGTPIIQIPHAAIVTVSLIASRSGVAFIPKVFSNLFESTMKGWSNSYII